MKYKDDKVNPLDMGNSLREGAAAMYGGTPVDVDVDQGRVVAKGILLEKVRADLRQPRRAIPASVRLYWDGTQGGVNAMLGAWLDIAIDVGGELDVVALLKGQGDGVDTEGKPPIFEQFVELARLAADINRVGLSNPINVVEQAGSYVIESGERRWLAYNMLAVVLKEKRYERIPAFIQDGRNFVWRQATENTARRSLNAIGMARQLALLIMEARRGIDGQQYDEWEDMVVPGGCDRAFYAQVANGNIHRVPKGMGERIQQAMGLSKSQLSRYRDLLRLTDNNEVNDALWTRADVEDWAEGVLREVVDRLPIGNLSRAVSRDDWELKDLRDAIDEQGKRKVYEALERQTAQRQADTRPAAQTVPVARPEPAKDVRLYGRTERGDGFYDNRRDVDPLDDPHGGAATGWSTAEIVARATGRHVETEPEVDYDIELPKGFHIGGRLEVMRSALVYYWERNRLKLHGDGVDQGTLVTLDEAFAHEGQTYAVVRRDGQDAAIIVRMKVLAVPVRSGQASDKADSGRGVPEVPELVNDLLRFMIQSRRMEATASMLKNEPHKYADYAYAEALDEFRAFHEAAADLLADGLAELRRYLDAVSSITRLPGDDDA